MSKVNPIITKGMSYDGLLITQGYGKMKVDISLRESKVGRVRDELEKAGFDVVLHEEAYAHPVHKQIARRRKSDRERSDRKFLERHRI